MKILLGTKNPGKVKETNLFFNGTSIEFIGIDSLNDIPEFIEDGNTYHENALKKAMTLSLMASLPILTEDSGLEVDYLNGKPGVYSARFAGENATDVENNQKVLSFLKGVPSEKRAARFVSILCLILDKIPHFFEGEIRGYILETPRGEYGFGYDPIFVPEGYNRSFAKLGGDIKNMLSHRARALKKLKSFLKERNEKTS